VEEREREREMMLIVNSSYTSGQLRPNVSSSGYNSCQFNHRNGKEEEEEDELSLLLPFR
jgi:hypothetical protein